MKRGSVRTARIEEQRERFATITSWFAHHAIRELHEHRAVFMRPRDVAIGTWDNIYWFEVAMLSGRKLLVHGDTEHVLFAYHGAESSLVSAVGWLAHQPLGSSYVKEKANIGMHVRMLENDRVHIAHAALRCAWPLLQAADS